MEFKGVITVNVLEAKNLVAADKSGTSDPYVVLTLGKQVHKTKVIDKNLQPVWNEEFHFYSFHDQWKEELKVAVFDFDTYSAHDSLGECTVKGKSDLNEGENFDSWIKLTKAKKGEIHLSVSFRLLQEGENVQVEIAEDENDAELKVKQKGDTYWPLKGSVYPPSEWKAPSDILKAPNQALSLEFVYGYRGHDCRDNLFITHDNQLVYNAAALGVVFDTDNVSQTFYGGHNDDICSLAIHPNGEIVATGQVASTKGVRKPRICVWNIKTKETIADISGFHERAVVALGFSPDGNHLVSVGADDHNSVAVYNWKTKALVASSYGSSAKIMVSTYSKSDNSTFVTCGVKHIKFWNLEGGKLNSKEGVFKRFPIQSLVSADFLASGDVVTGAYSGDVYFWRDGEAIQGFKAHEGPVNAVLATEDGVFTGGKDGKITHYHVDADLNAKAVHTYDLNVHNPLKGEPLGVRALSIKGERLVVGTTENSLHEINLSTKEVKNLFLGHSGEVFALATHPSDGEFVTGGQIRL